MATAREDGFLRGAAWRRIARERRRAIEREHRVAAARHLHRDLRQFNSSEERRKGAQQ